MNEVKTRYNEKFNFTAVNVSKTYGGISIVKDFNLSISNGEVIGLIGDNGVGKSTIMRIAALVESRDTGEIQINGESADNRIKYYRSKIGYIPQSDALIEEMTVIDNLKLFSLADKKQTAAKIEELAQAFDMQDYLHKKVKHLSGGMACRVNIAAGLINSPRMIVADEPFAGLDATQRKKVVAYLRRLAEQGVGQLISSHYVENLQSWSKSIITI